MNPSSIHPTPILHPLTPVLRAPTGPQERMREINQLTTTAMRARGVGVFDWYAITLGREDMVCGCCHYACANGQLR